MSGRKKIFIGAPAMMSEAGIRAVIEAAKACVPTIARPEADQIKILRKEVHCSFCSMPATCGCEVCRIPLCAKHGRLQMNVVACPNHRAGIRPAPANVGRYTSEEDTDVGTSAKV